MEPLTVSGRNYVEEMYKVIREMPAEYQSELINKLLEGLGLVVHLKNDSVTDNTISIGSDQYEKLAQKIEKAASELRNLSVRNFSGDRSKG